MSAACVVWLLFGQIGCAGFGDLLETGSERDEGDASSSLYISTTETPCRALCFMFPSSRSYTVFGLDSEDQNNSKSQTSKILRVYNCGFGDDSGYSANQVFRIGGKWRAFQTKGAETTSWLATNSALLYSPILITILPTVKERSIEQRSIRHPEGTA